MQRTFETTSRAVRDNALQLIVALLFSGVAYVIGNVVYNLFFHPLRKVPGPLKSRATHLWRHYRTVVGDLPFNVKALHDEYGPVVRIAPDELSFTSPDAWHDIYGHHSYEMAKSYRFYRFLGEKHTPESIITASRDKHSALRRQLAHGFSDKAMRAQEPIINGYVDLLIERLHDHAGNGKNTIDLRTWFTFMTFDVIGNLGFGSDFGCLENSYYHPWVKTITGNIWENAMLRVFTFYCPQFILVLLANHSPLFRARQKHNAMTRERTLSRMAIKEERHDLIEGLLKKKDILTQDELEMNVANIIIAGSETTATLLSGAAFWIGTNPDVLEKLTQEVRSSFNSDHEITLASVGNLKYMLACLNETFRVYPPVAFGLPRVVPKGGATVAGMYLPENTIASVWQWAANYSPDNFTKPDEFHPERFLGDEKFATDKIAALQPFSVGPRNCIGRNLAYAEMRLILAKILYNFDLELTPAAREWMKIQKVYILWDKPELPVYLKPVAKTH